MIELVKTVSDYGISLIIVVLFIYDWVTNKKKISQTLEQNKDCLKEMSVSSSNTAKSLELLQQSMNAQSTLLNKHDKRCAKTQEIVEEIKKEVIK